MKLVKAEEQLDLIKRGFPSKLEQEVHTASRFIVTSNLSTTNHDIGKIYINGEMMQIPARIYFPEPSSLIFF